MMKIQTRAEYTIRQTNHGVLIFALIADHYGATICITSKQGSNLWRIDLELEEIQKEKNVSNLPSM